MAYINHYANANGHRMNFLRKGDTAYQLGTGGKLLGTFHRDGNTWTSLNGQRSFQTNDPNGIIASGMAGSQVNGGIGGWTRLSGNKVTA